MLGGGPPTGPVGGCAGSVMSDEDASDITCVVCGDKSSGKHYGQFTCEGKNFMGIRMKLQAINLNAFEDRLEQCTFRSMSESAELRRVEKKKRLWAW